MKKKFNLNIFSNSQPKESCSACGEGKSCCGTNLTERVNTENNAPSALDQLLSKPLSRRKALSTLACGAGIAAAAASSGCASLSSEEEREIQWLKFKEYVKTNYRLMTDEERNNTISRLERLAELQRSEKVKIKSSKAIPGVLYGYAFNISKCRGYMDCVKACVKENNLDPDTGMQYIRIFEMKNGSMNLESANGEYFHEVPAAGHFYLGTQCFQCDNPPCVDVCPVGATWREPDGIVVIDYDWCIGCRYCEAACPYWGRRFNWEQPKVESENLNRDQHYLGNRKRSKGVMEKCTFCISRSRDGKLPACAEACPTGARVFGNLLDPESEISYVLRNKKVFRLKEDLGTEPKFWYFMD